MDDVSHLFQSMDLQQTNPLELVLEPDISDNIVDYVPLAPRPKSKKKLSKKKKKYISRPLDLQHSININNINTAGDLLDYLDNGIDYDEATLSIIQHVLSEIIRNKKMKQRILRRRLNTDNKYQDIYYDYKPNVRFNNFI